MSTRLSSSLELREAFYKYLSFGQKFLGIFSPFVFRWSDAFVFINNVITLFLAAVELEADVLGLRLIVSLRLFYYQQEECLNIFR